MALFKCKMCGGDLEIQEGITVCECEYCGTKQTIPALDNEKKLNLFNRANRLRLNSEFDKAANIYESIIAEFPEEAEGYWGLVLCNYGIEYVDDPATARKIPTCHRAAFESVTKDENYEMALEYADVVSQKVYRDEAREIDRIMSEFLSISKNEKPYDIFICYKETDASGSRTIDSVIAQDVYEALTDKGYRVFFSRISLEDKLGKQYEPYIFAALNSAKVMLAFGTKYEYFQAVWVKNEWSRFLKLMAKDKSKTLVPCYKDMDAYDIPDEFKALQAQDMGKVGAIQDLLRGVDKLIGKDTRPVVEIISASDGSALTTRGYIYLEDADFTKADMYFDKALDENPMSAEAYIGKVLARLKITTLADFKPCKIPADISKDFERAVRFSQGELKTQLIPINEALEKIDLYDDFRNVITNVIKSRKNVDKKYNEALEEKRRVFTYQDANNIRNGLDKAIALFESAKGYARAQEEIAECQEMKISRVYDVAIYLQQKAQKSSDEGMYIKSIKMLEMVRDYKDAAQQIASCYNKIDVIHKKSIYKKALYFYKDDKSISSLESAINLFSQILDWQDSRRLYEDCRNKLDAIRMGIENQRERAYYEQEYNRAFALIQKKDTASLNEALRILNTIPEWRDSNRLKLMCQGLCQHCGGEFKGFFGKKCANCGRPKDY